MKPENSLRWTFTTTRPYWEDVVLVWYVDFEDFLTLGNMPKDFDTYSATFNSLGITREIERVMQDEAGK